MKTRRNIYIIIGSILILLNLLMDIAEYKEYTREIFFNIGYLLGSHFLLIIGVVLLILANRVQKKINTIKQYEWDESIKNIGNSQSPGELL